MTRPNLHSESRLDVAIIGAGPAGQMLAAALRRKDIRVCVVGPTDVWQKRWCVWADEVASTPLATCVANRFDGLKIVVDESQPALSLPDYLEVDKEALWAQTTLHSGDDLSEGQRVMGRVLAVEHDPAASTLFLDDARTLQATVVVDASGRANPWVSRSGPAASAYQTAFGAVIEVSEPGALMPTLMDFRDSGVGASGPPTFLYALPLGDGRWFVEETVLVSRPLVSTRALKRRLSARLDSYQTVFSWTGAEEHCEIAMDIALPTPDQRVIPFGAAAGFVHPATGYQMAYTASKVEPVATAISAYLRAHHQAGPVDTRATWRSLWSPSERRNHSLYRFGGEVLIGLDTPQLRNFFGAFFSAPTDLWRGYLSRTLDTPQIARLMWHVHRALPIHSKRHISKQARHHLGPLLGQLLAPSTSPPIPAYAVSPSSP